MNESGKSGVFPIHPRTRNALKKSGLRFNGNILCIDPVGYFDMLELEKNADFIVTDSGGVQKEAYFFQKPCITLREETEWVETVEVGANLVVGVDKEKILDALNDPPKYNYIILYGNGKSGKEIIRYLLI